MPVVGKNIIANVIGRGWNMISIFLFIPIYINILGTKLYGVIGFYAILQGLLIFADTGLTASLRRELAKGDNSIDSRTNKYRILRSFESIYFVIVFLIIIGIYWGAEFIVNDWLNIEDLNIESTIMAIQLMGVALALNFIATFYQGGILGLEKQVVSNILQVFWGILKNGGVILALLFIKKSPVVFFNWHIGINLFYVLVLRHFIFSYLKQKENLTWQLFHDFNVLKHVWKYAAGMFLISIIAALNSQLDKLILSNYLTISDLAIYTIAYSIAMIPIVLARPISTAIFPRLVSFVDNKKDKELTSAFDNSFKFIMIVSGGTGIILTLYSNLFLNVWMQNAEIATSATLPASLLIVGQVFLSFQIIPFNLALAKGNTNINLVMGVVGLVILIPLVVTMAKSFGMIGVALSWLIYSGIFTPIYIVVVLKRLTDISIISWSLRNFIKPIIILLTGNLAFFFLKPSSHLNTVSSLLYVFLTASFVSVLSFKYTYNIRFKNMIKFVKHELFP